jgi:hypothetical protein
MKKIFFIATVLTFLCKISFGQGLGIKAGYSNSSVLFADDAWLKYGSSIPEIKPTGGFHLGATFDVPISDVFYFEPGLIFVSKGYKNDYQRIFSETTIDFTYTNTIYYLDIPLYLKAKVKTGNISFYGAFGPYFGTALFGYAKLNGDKNSIDFSENNIKRIDAGLSFSGGLEVGQIQLGATYDLGLLNTSGNTIDKRQNRVFSLSLGYRFNQKSK